jgi:hypothetical protein
LVRAETELGEVPPQALQDRWTHRGNAALGPFEVVDLLGELANDLVEVLDSTMANPNAAADFVRAVAATAPGEGPTPGLRKLERYALPILAGLIVGDWFNALGWHDQRKAAA